MMRIATILIAGLICCTANGQEGALRSHLSFEYGGQLPVHDLDDRFGANFNAGSQFELLHMKSGWHAGLKGYFLFGSTVKQDVLANLRNDEGNIIGNDRTPALIFLRERGFFIGPYVGKILRLSSNQPHSGIKFSLGAGLLQHKIRLQDDSQTITQITGEYAKGYDRLTNGFVFYGFAGYQHLDPNGRINFLAGFDYTIGQTQNRRDFNFDEMQVDQSKRTDGLIGFRIGWILPITTGESADEIYY